MDIFKWADKYASQADVYQVLNTNMEQEAASIIKEFKEALAGKKIVLWGAGTVGRMFYLLLKEMGIVVNCIIDRGGESVPFLDGRKVLPGHGDGLGEKLQDAIIIATVNRSLYDEVKRDILSAGAREGQIVCGHDIHMVAQSAFCMEKAVQEGQTIEIKNCYECTNLDNTCTSLNRYLKRINQFQDTGKGTQAVRMVGYALGNICTLQCKNCCESVPYMPKESRRLVPWEEAMKDIRKMSRACRFLTLLEFIGGEPFLHPDFWRILKEVKQIRNIGIIHVFTNGTVVPDEKLCNELSDERITVYLSNYQATLPGKFLEKIRQTQQKLDGHGVQYFFGKKQNWMDFSQYEQVNTDAELKQAFADCFLHNCNRLQEGTLYVCAHQYAGIKLGKLGECGETVKIHNYTDEELGMRLEEMKRWEAIDACKYCTMPYKAKTVLSGEQL